MAVRDETGRDPRWEWFEIVTPGSSEPVRWVRGACRHLSTVPVEDADGKVVANLCRDCDAQLPAW